MKTCPACRARKVRRLISRTGFVLKGGGWYSDLYSSAKPGGADKDGGGDAKSESASEGKGEKPAADAKPAGGAAKPAGGSSGGGKKKKKTRAA